MYRIAVMDYLFSMRALSNPKVTVHLLDNVLFKLSSLPFAPKYSRHSNILYVARTAKNFENLIL